jgi:hypothetical protein
MSSFQQQYIERLIQVTIVSKLMGRYSVSWLDLMLGRQTP